MPLSMEPFTISWMPSSSANSMWAPMMAAASSPTVAFMRSIWALVCSMNLATAAA